MPELPDVTIYVGRLDAFLRGNDARRVRLRALSRLLKEDWPRTLDDL